MAEPANRQPTTEELEKILADLEFFQNLESLELLPLEEEPSGQEEPEEDGDE